MKTLKKILPILATAGVATIPLATTGCSRLWIDMLEKQYTPSFDAYTTEDGTNEVSSIEAKDIYLNYFVQHPENLIPDFYWGASLYGREGLPSKDTDVKTFLACLSNMNVKKGTLVIGADAPVISYSSKVQMELKHPGLSGSYAINTYDLSWEFNNLAVWPVYYKTIENKHCWSISPVKFDTYTGKWWWELNDDEQIKFDFKAVFKGFGKNGGQNYIRETSESAIIDDDHKYAPELNEIYTNIMLFDSYYLHQLAPRMIFDNPNVEAKWDGSKYVSKELGITIGKNTYQKYKDAKIKFKVPEDWVFPYSPLGSEIKISNLTLPIPESVTIETLFGENRYLKFAPTFEVTGTPYDGDRLYYIIQMECIPQSETSPAWTEYLFVSTSIVPHE